MKKKTILAPKFCLGDMIFLIQECEWKEVLGIYDVRKGSFSSNHHYLVNSRIGGWEMATTSFDNLDITPLLSDKIEIGETYEWVGETEIDLETSLKQIDPLRNELTLINKEIYGSEV